MKRRARIPFHALVLLLTACSGTGGIIGGLVPAPKFLDGRIEGSTYFAPENAFSVQLPHPPLQSHRDRYEWTYTKVHEISDGPIIGVVFGPAAFDLNLYHAVLIRAPMKPDKEAHVNEVFGNKVKARTGAYTQKARQQFQVNGRPCYYAVYESPDWLLVLSLTDAGSSFYAVEADVYKRSRPGVTTLDELVNRKWDIFDRMLESFSVAESAK